MRVVITDTAFLWNHENPVLEVFKDILLVVCLEGKAVTDKYECFVSPFKAVSMGADRFGYEDYRFKALESVGDALHRNLSKGGDILFLTDGNPESLYPFFVLKNIEGHGRLHLCAASPFRFESKRRKQGHKKLLSDLSQLTSILYIESDKYLVNLEKNITIGGVLKKIEKDLWAIMPTLVNSIEKLDGRFYFDFASNSYVAIEEGFNAIDLSKKNQLDTGYKVKLQRTLRTMGIVCDIDYPLEDKETKEEVERTPARIDGRDICEYLREQRIELARANGIEFSSEECPSVGPCAGTCAKCDQESAYLRDKLAEIPLEKRIIPDFTLTEWEV